MHMEHIKNMEQIIEKHNLEHADVEKRLRKDVEVLQIRNQELETKLVEAASMVRFLIQNRWFIMSANVKENLLPISARQ